jgi:outer membrane lipoprotein-sorting protein
VRDGAEEIACEAFDAQPSREQAKGEPIMKSPLTKIVIAVVVAAAGITALTMWTGTGSGVALADVLTRIQQVSIYMYQMSGTMTGQMAAEVPVDQDVRATILISQDHGMKMSMEMTDPNSGGEMLQEMYMLPAKKTMVAIMPSQKKYMRMEFDDAVFERTQKQNSDPSAMVKQILDCEYTGLGRSTIDGIEVEGFQTTDPNYVGGIMGKVDVKIWVDVKTQLPVRSEMDMQMGDKMHMHAVVHDFQWDVSVDASEFDPVIPDDYTSLTDGPFKMPAMDEETAIQGLKLFAELSGAYPEKLDIMTLMSQVGELATKELPSTKELREQGKPLDMKARTQEIMDTMRPIQGLGMFHMLLVQDKKDPAYYGDIVTPEDEDQVLMRWKVSDTEYRVIFGSLHTETVTADVLAELEESLPK